MEVKLLGQCEAWGFPSQWSFTMFNMNTVTVYSYSFILLSLLVDLLVVIGDNSKLSKLYY